MDDVFRRSNRTLDSAIETAVLYAPNRFLKENVDDRTGVQPMGMKIVGRLSPILSFASGLAAVFLFRRDADFAPISALIAIVAWILAILFSGSFQQLQLDNASPDSVSLSKGRALFHWASRNVVIGLYQNVLFFLLPIWFGSAEIHSVNIVFPLILAGLAVVSCFDGFFAAHVLSHVYLRASVSALVLFSVSIPAFAVFLHLPIRLDTAICAAVASFAAVFSNARSLGVFRATGLGIALASVCGAFFYAAAIFLPPVPVQCMEKVAATGMENRTPLGVNKVFPSGVPKVYVHFYVAAPDRFRQDIRFQWYVNDDMRGRPIASQIVGGRKQGFHTWTFLSNPHAGDYRVDLLTSDNQLIARTGFRVK
jgi:hypothetical protein